MTALAGDRAINDRLLKRVLYGISCRNYRSRGRGDSWGHRAVGVDGVLGASSRPARRSSAHSRERDLAGEDVVVVVLDGKTFADATMVIALGITLSGEKRFLGFVETDTENERVLTSFLRSLVERGLDVSQGTLVIPRRREGAPGGRSEGLPGPGPGPPVPVAQARKRGQLPGQAGAGLLAPAPPARLQPSRVRRGPHGARDTPSRAGGPEPIGGRQSGGRAGRDPNAASSRACMACWAGR